MERDLFDGWVPEVQPTIKAVRPQVLATTASVIPNEPTRQTTGADVIRREPTVVPIEIDQTRQPQPLKSSTEIAEHQPPQLQRGKLTQPSSEILAPSREALTQELASRRATFEQELAARDSEWTAKRDQEWTALRSAKAVQDISQQRLMDELSAKQVREREELMQWRRQAETELAEARKLFEQERMNQQQEFIRQREVEMGLLRREREEFDTRVRQIQSELAFARRRQEDELQQAREVQAAHLQAERAELEKLRDTWVEKFRREQVVLQDQLQFFGQHLSRISEDLRDAQREVPVIPNLATQTRPTEMSVKTPVEPQRAPVNMRLTEPAVLSLEEIRERLNELRKPQGLVA